MFVFSLILSRRGRLADPEGRFSTRCYLADPEGWLSTRRCLAGLLALASILDPEEHPLGARRPALSISKPCVGRLNPQVPSKKRHSLIWFGSGCSSISAPRNSKNVYFVFLSSASRPVLVAGPQVALQEEARPGRLVLAVPAPVPAPAELVLVSMRKPPASSSYCRRISRQTRRRQPLVGTGMLMVVESKGVGMAAGSQNRMPWTTLNKHN